MHAICIQYSPTFMPQSEAIRTFNPNDLRINVPSVKISTSEHCIKNLTNISYVTLRNVFSIIRIMITYILLLDSFLGENIFFYIV